MKISKFKVENRQIRIVEYNTVLTGYQNVDTFKFEFDEEWNELDKTLTLFVDNKPPYSVALLNNEAILPSEVYKSPGIITFGIFGKKDEVTLSSVLINFHISKGAYVEGQEPSNLPTPTQWDLYIAEISKLLKACQLSEEECKKALKELIKLRDETLAEMQAIKNETQNFRDETSKLKDDTQAIADDVKDFASAMTFATFEVNPETGELFLNSADSLGNMGFSVEEDGNLYVEIGEEV